MATLPAISLWRPWASLWMCGRKRYETRHWPIKVRGRLAVHAAQRLETDLALALLEIVEGEFGVAWAAVLPRGCLLGTLDIHDCFATESTAIYPLGERDRGNFTPGRYAGEGRNRVPLGVPGIELPVALAPLLPAHLARRIAAHLSPPRHKIDRV